MATVIRKGSPQSNKPVSDSTSSKEQPTHAAVDKVQAMLGQMLRVSGQDGRVFVGEFVAFDAQGNIVLEQTVEQSIVDGLEYARDIGFALIPRKQWTRVESITLQD